ncbi:MAG: rod shape-determining protein MreD [Oscillospiraceae bacterium]|nr:rod shape-determining protein MreD [Oscillospiraceae bacterium]
MSDVNRRLVTDILRWFFYVLILLLAYVLQGTPNFLSIGGIKPLFILPVAVIVSALEGALPGAFFGAFAGMLWDLLSGRTAGFFSLLFIFLGFMVGVTVSLFLRRSYFNIMLLTLGAGVCVTFVDFLIGYLMFQYTGAATHYFGTIFPTLVYTTALSPAWYWIISKIHRRFQLYE